jgi:hypothetical protein
MIRGYIGGTPARLRQLADVYRETGDRSGHADDLRLGIALHYFGAPSLRAAASTYPYLERRVEDVECLERVVRGVVDKVTTRPEPRHVCHTHQ